MLRGLWMKPKDLAQKGLITVVWRAHRNVTAPSTHTENRLCPPLGRNCVEPRAIHHQGIKADDALKKQNAFSGEPTENRSKL